ncbi:hypothetical protein ccbrp13_63540 [Ktedonobacteria bacterium brp13]|nr:hypothetical protein ccbrp13_63540 [Ktedonobacteria bacterium brp13]
MSEVIDFLAVLVGYAISSACTLEAFYAHLYPFAHELRNELVEELSVEKEMTNHLKLDRMHMRTGCY